LANANPDGKAKVRKKLRTPAQLLAHSAKPARDRSSSATPHSEQKYGEKTQPKKSPEDSGL